MFKHRYLIVKRRENLTEPERDDLTRMLEYLPELATLRRFADRIYWLFDTPKDAIRRVAVDRRSCATRRSRRCRSWSRRWSNWSEEKFPKLMAYLNNPLSRRVRTNNHVERTNRMFRFLEKVRYKWRRRRTLVRFVVLRLDEIWRDRITAETNEADRSEPRGSDKTEGHKKKRDRAA